jgi:hypothetical protein
VNVEKQIAKLESLLGRIKRNAEKGRPHAVAAPQPSVARAVMEEPPHSALPPTARADVTASPVMPAAVSTPPAPVVARPAAPVVAAPEPVVAARTPAPVVAAPAAEPVGAADAAASGTEFEEFDMMDAEIVELGGAAEEAPAQEIQEASLELEASITEEEAPAELEADFGDAVEESVPKSAPRPAVQAIAEAELDLEPPVKTPPPESGRQIVAPIQAPAVTYQDDGEEADLTGAADVDSLLEPDLSGGPISKAPPGMPTMEQLGDTVELEGADAPAARLELAVQPLPVIAEPELDDMELELPKQEFSGAYDAKLAAPATATADLERHQRVQDAAAAARAPVPEQISSPAASLHAAPPAPVMAMPAPAMTPPAGPTAPAAPAAPVVVERPPLDVMHAAEVVPAAPAKTPETFLELLDQSLSLKV